MQADITLDELRSYNTLLAHVMNSIYDGVYIVDRHRRILFWNTGAEQITGWPAEAVLGRCCSDNILNHIDCRGRLLCKGACPLVHAIGTGQPIEERVYPLHRDGHRFPVVTHVFPLRNREGEIIAAVEVFRDATKEESLRQLQEKFEILVKRYVSQATFEAIHAQARGDEHASAQVRDLTILYLDVVGFTAYSETHPPEAIVGLLNDVFGICDVLTREHHGDIDKFMGDAIMATFIDANDAVHAALEVLLEAMPGLNGHRLEAGEPPVQVRIGINSGYVVQGDVGTLDRKDLTVIGDVVNIAQRVQSVSQPDGLLITEATFSRLTPAYAARFHREGQVMVKGHATPIEILRLITEANVPTGGAGSA